MDQRNEAIEDLHDALAEHFPIKDAQVLMSRRGLDLPEGEALVILSPSAMHFIARILNNEPTGKEDS